MGICWDIEREKNKTRRKKESIGDTTINNEDKEKSSSEDSSHKNEKKNKAGEIPIKTIRKSRKKNDKNTNYSFQNIEKSEMQKENENIVGDKNKSDLKNSSIKKRTSNENINDSLPNNSNDKVNNNSFVKDDNNDIKGNKISIKDDKQLNDDNNVNNNENNKEQSSQKNNIHDSHNSKKSNLKNSNSNNSFNETNFKNNKSNNNNLKNNINDNSDKKKKDGMNQGETDLDIKKAKSQQRIYYIQNSLNEPNNIQMFNSVSKEKSFSNNTPGQSYNYVNNNNNQLSNNNNNYNMNNPENPDLNINNSILKSNSNINNSQKHNNYSQFSLDKNYYLCCPVCNNCVPHIEKFGYDYSKSDFNIDYICPCIYSNHKTKAYFSKLITEKKPKNICPNHKSKELLFFCKECNIQICKLCEEEEHQNHEIDKNINIISKEDAEKMKQIAYMTRSQFQGYELIEKLYNSYCAQNNENSRNFNGESYMGSQINVFQGHEKINNENDIDKGKIINQERIIEESFGYQSIFPQPVNKDPNQNPINNNKSQCQNEIDYSGENNRQNDEKNKSNNNNNSDDNNNPFNNDNNDNNSNKDSINYIEPDFINEYNNINDKNNIDIEPRKYINKMTLKGKDKNDKNDKIVSLIQLESGDIATGSYNSQVRIWDIKTGQCILSFHELGNVLCLLEFKPDQLLAGTSENNIGLWYLNEIKKKTKYDNHPPDSVFNFLNHTLYVNCLVKYNDKWFASASNDTTIIMWDYFKREQVFELQSNKSILSLIKLNDGKLCSGGEDLTIKIWDVNNRTCIKTLLGHEKWIRCLCQLSDGTLLSGGDDENIKIWTNYDFDCIGTLSGHNHAVRTICQIDNKYFASGSFDNRIIIWDIQDMKYCSELRGHSSNVICIIKLKDNRLCSCSTDGTVKIWE